jgi:hypothetical protein
MRIGTDDQKVFGTLIVPEHDFPALGALLTIGASMLRFTFHYQLFAGKEKWEQEEM